MSQTHDASLDLEPGDGSTIPTNTEESRATNQTVNADESTREEKHQDAGAGDGGIETSPWQPPFNPSESPDTNIPFQMPPISSSATPMGLMSPTVTTEKQTTITQHPYSALPQGVPSRVFSASDETFGGSSGSGDRVRFDVIPATVITKDGTTRGPVMQERLVSSSQTKSMAFDEGASVPLLAEDDRKQVTVHMAPNTAAGAGAVAPGAIIAAGDPPSKNSRSKNSASGHGSGSPSLLSASAIQQANRKELVNKSVIFSCIVLVLVGLGICLFLYYYLRRNELHVWRDQFSALCDDRYRAFQFFISFSVSSLRSVAGFGISAQNIQHRNGTAPTQADFLAFNDFAPTQDWLDQILFYPHVTNVTRADWERTAGYSIMSVNLTATTLKDLLYPTPNREHFFPWQFFYPYTDRTAIATGLDASWQPGLLPYIDAAVQSASVHFSDRNPLAFSATDTSKYGIIITLPLFINATQNSDVFNLPIDGSAASSSTGLAPPVEDRYKNLLGIVQCVLRIAQLLNQSISTLQPKSIYVDIIDKDALYPNISFIASFEGQGQEELDLSESVIIPTQMGHRNYEFTCSPSENFVDSAYSWTPVIIAVLAGAVILLNIVFILAASVVMAAKRAFHMSSMLAQTDEAKGEALRILKQSQALSEQHNQSKSDFLAFLCHELRNPLHAVGSLVEFLLQSDTLLRHLDSEDATHLETIDQQVKLMNSIVNDALDLSKIEAGRMQFEMVAFNLKKLCLSLTSGYRTKALSQGISLKVDVSDRVPHTLYSDPTRLRQILSNLLSNAIKFTQVGSVTLLVSVVSEPWSTPPARDAGAGAGGDVGEDGPPAGLVNRGSNGNGTPGDAARPIGRTILTGNPRALALGNDVPSADSQKVVVVLHPTAKDTSQQPPSAGAQSLIALIGSEAEQSLKAATTGGNSSEDGSDDVIVTVEQVRVSDGPVTPGTGVSNGGPNGSSRNTHNGGGPNHSGGDGSVRRFDESSMGRRAGGEVSERRDSVKHSSSGSSGDPNGGGSKLGHAGLSTSSRSSVRVRFQVIDTGCGLSEEGLKGLFQPYFQAKASVNRTHGGTGLGLSIVRQIVELLGGTIHVSSAVGVGTTMTVEVPLPTQRRARRTGGGASQEDKFNSSEPSRTPALKSSKGGGAIVSAAGGKGDSRLGSKASRRSVTPHFGSRDPHHSRAMSLEAGGTSERIGHDGPARGTPKLTAESAAATDAPSPNFTPLRGGNDEVEMQELSQYPRFHDDDIKSDDSKPVAGSIVAPDGDASAPISLSTQPPVSAITVPPVSRTISGGSDSVTSTSASSSSSHGKSGVGSGMTILVVDDSAINLKIMCRMLEGEGCKCMTARDGQEALDMVKNRHRKFKETIEAGLPPPSESAQFAFIFSDVLMPVLDGLSACRLIREYEVRESLPPIPICAVSANALLHDRQSCFEAGFSLHLAKPFVLKQIRRVISRAKKSTEHKLPATFEEFNQAAV